jgi:hypothetical protein
LGCAIAFADPHAGFRQPEARTVTTQQLMPEPPADPEAENLPDDRREDADREQRPDIETVAGREKRRCNQGCLGGQGNPDALERDERRHQPDAVIGYELRQVRALPTGTDQPDLRTDPPTGTEPSSPKRGY